MHLLAVMGQQVQHKPWKLVLPKQLAVKTSDILSFFPPEILCLSLHLFSLESNPEAFDAFTQVEQKQGWMKPSVA